LNGYTTTSSRERRAAPMMWGEAGRVADRQPIGQPVEDGDRHGRVLRQPGRRRREGSGSMAFVQDAVLAEQSDAAAVVDGEYRQWLPTGARCALRGAEVDAQVRVRRVRPAVVVVDELQSARRSWSFPTRP